MRLPQDHNRWTLRHAERAMEQAWRLFERYEYRYACDEAAGVPVTPAGSAGACSGRDRSLP